MQVSSHKSYEQNHFERLNPGKRYTPVTEELTVWNFGEYVREVNQAFGAESALRDHHTWNQIPEFNLFHGFPTYYFNGIEHI